MSQNKSLGLLAGAALCLASSAGLAQDEDKAYRAELLADADGRSSLLAANASTHHEDGHFGFTDAQGNNSLNIGLFTQYRHLFNFADTSSDSTDDFSHGGQLNRLRLFFFGTVGSPNMEYFIQLGADPIGGFGEGFPSGAQNQNLRVLDAEFKYMFSDTGVYARFGQGRPAQGFEETTHSWDQQFMDRSIANDLLTPGRQQFLALGYDDGEMFKGEVFFSDGAQSSNTDFISTREADFAIGGRLDAIFTGTPEDFETQSSFPGSTQGFRAGIGGQWETHGDTGLGSPSDFDAIYGSADAEFRGDGYSIRGHGYMQFVDPRMGGETTHWGGAIRGGYFLDPNWEAFAGWEAIIFDEDVAEDDNFQNFVRAGVNFFPFEDSTAVRFTGELIVGVNNTNVLNSGFNDVAGGDAATPNFTGTRHNILGDDDTEFGIGIQASVLN